MEVLNTITVGGFPLAGTIAILILSGLGIIASVCWRNAPAARFGFIFFPIAFVFSLYCLFVQETPHKRYEVIFSDEVTFHEVMDKYKIIETRGDIYVIEERDDI